MLSFESQIIQLEEVKDCINFAVNAKKIVCIGVDGPTASGKTVFAQLLKQEILNISNKDVQLVPLDSLLVERTVREKSLQNIHNVGIPFEHEAEMHMRFSKFDNLLNLTNLKKLDLSDQTEITIENLYSRSDEGRCTGKLKINLTNETVLIFEGHYTTRPEFNKILDKNFILLAKRENLIRRKIERVANYRDKKEVEDYFDLIDEPSYLSNYYRFASQNSVIIDNSEFSKPFCVGYNHIQLLLNTKKFLEPRRISSEKIKEFIFGLHGLSNYCLDDQNNIEKLLDNLNNKDVLESKKTISETFSINKISHKISYFDYLTKNKIEVGLVVKLFEINSFWIISKSFGRITHLVFWEGGVFKIKNGIIDRLYFLKEKDHSSKKAIKNFWENLHNGKAFITSALLSDNLKVDGNARCFLDNVSRVSFFASALKHTQFNCRSLGDFFVISYRGSLEDKTEKITSIPSVFTINESILSKNENYYYQKKSSAYILTTDFLILKTYLTQEILKELQEIYFESTDITIRSAIINGLLHEDNQSLIPENIRNYLQYSIGFFPVSMSRLYVLKRMGLEETNVLAANIYDITEDSIDSSAYIETAFENSLPTIVQISLNASGQAEINPDGSKMIGYLQPEQGIYDFTSSICNSLVKILDDRNSKNQSPPFIGIGLDHVDVRGNYPTGRSSRFVRQAIQTESVTHLTLDGSAHFKPRKKVLSELFKAYVEVFRTSLSFLDKINIDGIDLEFCTGELNYIGEETSPHYPDGKEMSILPICLSCSLDKEKDLEYKAALSNSLKLYVGNLGTTHHGNDKESFLKLELAEEWQQALEGTNFVSPVLHGTTGSSDETFSLASKSCQKINIAGSFLRVLLENLNLSQKKVLGFNSFDNKSKFLCAKFGLIQKDQAIISKKELKKEFFRYSKLNNVKPISKQNEKIVRKPIYGRNKIARHIFSKMEQLLI
tara:strand:- start:3954 stop:6803 length:2850 start_codon:yes stop_codon:yes gene_type:complete